MRILMIAPQPFFRARGTPFSVLHRIRALIELGHSVDLITYPFGEDIELPNLRTFRAGKPPLINDVTIGPSIGKIFLDIWLYVEAAKRLKVAEQPYDVLHTHEEAAFFGMRLSRKYNLPHIYDMHSSLPQQLNNFKRFNIGLIRQVFEKLELSVLKQCIGVITICDELAEIVARICPEKPHSMIENTADDSKVFSADDVDAAEKYNLTGKKVALYTGTFEAYQGLDLLIEAFALASGKNPQAQLLMVGGRDDQIENVRLHAKRLGIDEKVTFTGTVHPSLIPPFLKVADVIVSPRSTGTNTPLKIYGYLRSGRPLVATDKLTHTQTLDSSVAHLVPPTAEGIAGGILKIFADEAYAESLSRAAIAKATAEFSDQAYIEKVREFYASAFPTQLKQDDQNDEVLAGAH